jgi:hypothetical protein
MKLVGERRAIAAAIMAFYFLVFGLNVISGELPDPFVPIFAGFAGVYGLAFFALVAGYFWARWYTLGVGLFGVIVAIIGLFQLPGDDPPAREILLRMMLTLGGTHLAATLLLWGDSMSHPYDGQAAWRERFHMDENAVQRLGRAVIRTGMSLPFVLLYALAPRPGSAAGSAAMIASLAALALTGLGLRALIRLRTWGVLALAASGVMMLALATVGATTAGITSALLRPGLAGVLLLAAAVPFLPPMARWLRARAV